MASAEDIQWVKDNLPPEAASHGWDNAKIDEAIDAETRTRAVRAYWSFRVAQTNELVSINESGSSRNLEDVWKHALEMLKYWDGRVAQEDDSNGVVTKPKAGIAFHTATRV